MRFSTWQIIILLAIVVVGAQAPMFALAQSIGDDEAAKSALGWLVSGVLGAIATFAIGIYAKQRESRQIEELRRMINERNEESDHIYSDQFDTMVNEAKQRR